MPTVVLLDASLSMLRPVDNGRRNCLDKIKRLTTTNKDCNLIDIDSNKCVGNGLTDTANKAFGGSEVQLINLAKWGIDKLLSHFEQSYKLEQVAVLSYSSQCDLVVPFTRDIAEVRGKVTLVEAYDTTNIHAGLAGVATYVKEHWGNAVPINCVLITDGEQYGQEQYTSDGDLLSRLETIVPFGFTGSLSILCINHVDNPSFTKKFKSINEKLIQRSGLEGEVYMIEENTNLSRRSVESMFQRFIDLRYRPYCGTLYFGKELSSPVTLCPPPTNYKEVRDFETVEMASSRLLKYADIFRSLLIC